MAAILRGVQSMGRMVLRSIPLFPTAADSPAVRSGRGVVTSVQHAGGTVIVEPRDMRSLSISNLTPAKQVSDPILSRDSSLPQSIHMLAANKIDVPPALLLKLIQWDLLRRPISSGLSSAFHSDLQRTHSEVRC